MPDIKTLRAKALSSMSYEELTDFISKAEGAGFNRSTSKELGKAEDLRKTLRPDKYGAETVTSAKEKLLTSTTPQTQTKLGLSNIKSSASPFGLGTGQQPELDLNKMYESSLNDPALLSLQEELDAKKRARDEAEADINDNPYYSEATRVGKISKLDRKALNEINTLQSQIEQKKADALVKINIATQQYNIEDKQYQNNLQKLNLLISSGAITGASSQDIGQIALATGMSTEMVNAIINNVKQGQIQTSVTTNTDDNGNVTVSVINTKTGEIVAQNSLGQIGNKQTGGTTTYIKPGSAEYQEGVRLMSQDLASKQGADKYVAPGDYRELKLQWVNANFNPDDFDKTFEGFINPSHAQDYIYSAGKTGTVINLGD